MTPRFLDTNILIHYFTRDDEAKARRALALLRRLEGGQEKVVTSPLAVFELVFTLQRRYRMPRRQVRELVAPLLALRGLRVPGRADFLRALALYEQAGISFADAFNAVSMRRHHLSEIYSEDAHFDRLEGITRVEPEGEAA